MKNFAIIDDDDASAEMLTDYITRFMEEKKMLFKITRYKEAVTFLTLYKPNFDIVFMDIMMPHMDGMEASAKLREVDKNVVLLIVTDMANYAIRGYEVNAYDFVLKNISFDNFSLKMKRALNQANRNEEGRLVVSTQKGMEILCLNELIYVEVLNHTVTYNLFNRVVSSYDSLAKVAKELEDKHFIKSSSSYMVNLKYVVSVVEGKEVILDDGKYTVPLTRAFKKNFMKSLANYLGGAFNV